MSDLSAHPQAFIHPVSGALTEATVANLRQAEREARDAIGRLHRALEPVREGLAAVPVALPEPTLRTETQKRIARCPRCNGRLDDPFEGEAA